MKGKMKAIVYHGQNDLRLEELDIPEIGPKDVLLKTKYASICGSDLHAVRRGPKWAKAEKQIFGHEFAAEIAEVGSEITRYKVGDRVFGVNMAFCGECWYCRHQDYAHCTGVGDHYTGQGIPGACAQYFKFTDPESEYAFAPYLNSLMPIPDEMTDEQCAMMEPFGVGLGAVNKAGVKEGDTVVILGTGIIGISSLQWCKARGARVIVVAAAATAWTSPKSAAPTMWSAPWTATATSRWPPSPRRPAGTGARRPRPWTPSSTAQATRAASTMR